MNARELVLEEVLARIVDEHGVETMALNWAILNELMKEEAPPEKSEEPAE